MIVNDVGRIVAHFKEIFLHLREVNEEKYYTLRNESWCVHYIQTRTSGMECSSDVLGPNVELLLKGLISGKGSRCKGPLVEKKSSNQEERNYTEQSRDEINNS